MIYLKEYNNYNSYSIFFEYPIRVFKMEKPNASMTESKRYLNYIYTDDIRIIGFKNEYENIGYFHAIKYGRIYLAPNPFISYQKDYKYVDNSLMFWGGFEIFDEYQKMGYGRKTIEKFFDVIPELENILLFTESNIGKPFWSKIGGEKVLTLKEDEYDELSDGLLKSLKVYSGDLELFILKREKFIKK